MRPGNTTFVLATAGIVCLSAVGALAAWLGVAPLVGLPKIDFIGSIPTSGTTYNVATRELLVQAVPRFANFGPGVVRPITAPKSIDLRVLIADDEGAQIRSVMGHDLVLTGEIDHDGDGIVDHSGLLLTGEILSVGAQSFAGPADLIDFRFRITGGSLMSFFSGRDLGVNLTVEGSTFAGHFGSSFSGSAKGALGAIPCAGRIGDTVSHDLDQDGAQDSGEPGLNGVPVTLSGLDTFGNVVSMTTTTATGPRGQSGFYQFEGVCAGRYTVTAATPNGFEPANAIPVTLDGLSAQDVDFNFVSACAAADRSRLPLCQ